MSWLDKLKDVFSAKKAPKDLSELTRKFAPKEEAAPVEVNYLDYPKTLYRVEYPENGELDELRLIVFRGTETTEEKSLKKLEDVVEARCRNAKFTRWSEQLSQHRDAIVVLGAQAALDIKYLTGHGKKVMGYNERTQKNFDLAAATADLNRNFLEYLQAMKLPAPSFEYDKNGEMNMVMIPIADPVSAHGVMSYLKEIMEEHGKYNPGELQEYMTDQISGIALSGDAVKYLQTWMTVNNYTAKTFQRRSGEHDVPPREGNGGTSHLSR